VLPEAGDGEDGRIKSAVGIGTLLEDGLGGYDSVFTMTEDPELEIPVCKGTIVKRYSGPTARSTVHRTFPLLLINFPYDPFNYQRRESFEIGNIGSNHVPVDNC
jgi:(E)-4-hydroxy-3-methylbut-2-enyl-diphosphate synthase